MGAVQESIIQLTDIQNAVFENAAVVLALIDEEGHVVNINRTALKMIGKTKENTLNKLSGEVFNCINAISNNEVVCGRGEYCSQCIVRNSFTETFITGKEIYKSEGIFSITSEEEETRLRLQVSTSIININNHKYVLLTLDDISELKQKEAQLQELIATKDKFMSIISHDLRGPMSVVIEFISIIKSGINQYSKEQLLEFLELMKSSSTNSLKLLENLLLWARVQTGQLKFNPIDIQLHYIVSDNIELHGNRCENKEITIKCDIADELSVFGDYNMLNTVIRNLISNAIKFTSSGGSIIVSAFEQNDEILISVRDTGIGMSREVCGKIFSVDSKHCTEGTDGEQGSGLGLVLCKDFIEQHKGEIWVESTLGEGSTFYFSIPKVDDKPE